MDSSWKARFPPTVSKACSRCHSRKVKCDLQVPRCSTCLKQNEQCNITDCVTYSYAAVKSLQDHITVLQGKIDSLSHTTTQPTQISSDTVRFNDVRKEAEEIGVLAIGRPNHYSDSIYSESCSAPYSLQQKTADSLQWEVRQVQPLPESFSGKSV